MVRRSFETLRSRVDMIDNHRTEGMNGTVKSTEQQWMMVVTLIINKFINIKRRVSLEYIS